MPWQQMVADVGLELDSATGLPAYREVIVTVMRQSGKSTLVLSFEVDRCASWGSPQRVAYTAQTGWDARKKLLDDQVPVLRGSKLWPAVQRVYQAASAEAVVWKNGSRIDVMASSSSAGHGRTLDLGVIDEAFDDDDDRREQALLPTLATRPEGQLLVASTAGTAARSLYLKRKVDAGRAATESDTGSGIAYFEWSIPDDADIDDPEVWWQFMPALGWTIQPEAVSHARMSMSDSEFRRAFCNQWVSVDAGWFPPGAWAACDGGDPIPEFTEVVLGFDGSFSNDSTALVAVSLTETPHVEVVDCWERPDKADESWRVPVLDVEDSIRRACRRFDVREIVCDPFRWARTYQILEDEGLPIVEYPQSAPRMVPATQRFYEAVLNKTLTHDGDERLTRHVGNCVVKTDSRGSRLAKDTKNSPRKIDLAVAAVMAFDRAVVCMDEGLPAIY